MNNQQVVKQLGVSKQVRMTPRREEKPVEAARHCLLRLHPQPPACLPSSFTRR